MACGCWEEDEGIWEGLGRPGIVVGRASGRPTWEDEPAGLLDLGFCMRGWDDELTGAEGFNVTEERLLEGAFVEGCDWALVGGFTFPAWPDAPCTFDGFEACNPWLAS